jgi:hypothetical protein
MARASVLAGIDGGLDLRQHLFQRHHPLAVEVAALLRKDLVLDLQARRAGPLQHLYGAHHVDRIAEAGVGVDQQGNGDRIRDRRDLVGDFRERGQADVGRAEIHVGDAGAGDIDRLVAEVLDNAREQAVAGAGENRRFAAVENGL